MQAVIGGKFIDVNTLIRKKEKPQIKNTLFTLRHLEKKSKLYLIKQNEKIIKIKVEK